MLHTYALVVAVALIAWALFNALYTLILKPQHPIARVIDIVVVVATSLALMGMHG